jgi:hypothetical protein
MDNFPRSLIQIHYHNRTGGVREVMRLYASAFREIAGEDSLSIVCAEDRVQKSFRLPVSFTLMSAIIGLTLLLIIFFE